mmetsp:Transcript_4382/g.15715  ORF Transcript_4382/g.15715 Transcript_4382/m.15715 type:complete len:230 (+) Transcript_4382:519-1208(+)
MIPLSWHEASIPRTHLAKGKEQCAVDGGERVRFASSFFSRGKGKRAGPLSLSSPHRGPGPLLVATLPRRLHSVGQAPALAQVHHQVHALVVLVGPPELHDLVHVRQPGQKVDLLLDLDEVGRGGGLALGAVHSPGPRRPGLWDGLARVKAPGLRVHHAPHHAEGAPTQVLQERVLGLEVPGVTVHVLAQADGDLLVGGVVQEIGVVRAGLRGADRTGQGRHVVRNGRVR